MYLRGKRNETEKKIWGGDRKSSSRNDHLINQFPNKEPIQNKTSVQLGEEYGISATTIQRDAMFTKAVDAMPTETKEKILSGEQ